MTDSLQLHLIRHGETAWSLTGQHTGRTDLALTPHGEDQARTLAARLSGIAFDHVLVSPRLRARQTCELAGLGAGARIEPDLAEWDYGDFEGQRSVDIQQSRPDWNIWRDGCPHGETPADVGKRVDGLIRRLINLRGCVALFSHGQLGAAFGVRWIGLPVITGQHFTLAPASMSCLGSDVLHPKRPVIQLWNEIGASRPTR